MPQENIERFDPNEADSSDGRAVAWGLYVLTSYMDRLCDKMDGMTAALEHIGDRLDDRLHALDKG